VTSNSHSPRSNAAIFARMRHVTGRNLVFVAIVSFVAIALYALARPGLIGAGEPPTNDQLTIGITQEFEDLNPIVMSMLATTYLYRMVNRTLVALDENTEWQAQLAVEIPTMENGLARFIREDGVDKIEADWQIRQAATWGDGVPVTCHDLQFSWEVALSDFVSVTGIEIYRQVEKIRIDPNDPKRCTFVYREPKFFFNRDVFQFYAVPEHVERPVFEQFGNQPQGYEQNSLYTRDPTNPGLYHGPYRIVDIQLGSHVVFERNPTFYGEPANIERIITVLIPNTGTLEANLRSGTIDMVSVLGMTFDQALAFADRVEADGLPFDVNFKPSLVYEHIDLNLDNPFLQDVNVRRALVHAIDREGLTDALFGGRQPPALHNIAPIDPWYTEDPNQIVTYRHSRRLANRLLEEAGWHDARGRLSLQRNRRAVAAAVDDHSRQSRCARPVQVYLQDQWRSIGIDVRIQNEPARVFFGQTTRRRQFDGAAMYAWISSTPKAIRARRCTSTAKFRAKEQRLVRSESAGLGECTASMQLIESLDRRVRSEQRRLEFIHEILWHYTNEVPVIPLYYRSDVSVTPASIWSVTRLTGHQVLGIEPHRALAPRAARASRGRQRRRWPVTAYILRRLLQTVVVIGLLSFFCYYLMTLMPGDPVDEMIAANPQITSVDAERLRQLHGLDQPAHVRYWNWATMVMSGDLGYSRTYRVPVSEMLGQATA
jgi:peptide/nickel transport system substrate-binding protein